LTPVSRPVEVALCIVVIPEKSFASISASFSGNTLIAALRTLRDAKGDAVHPEELFALMLALFEQ
jgi:hypothetical protein